MGDPLHITFYALMMGYQKGTHGSRNDMRKHLEVQTRLYLVICRYPRCYLS